MLENGIGEIGKREKKKKIEKRIEVTYTWIYGSLEPLHYTN